MGTYKLTNVTNLAGKRDFKFNSVLDIEYIDNMMKKTVKLKPGDSLYLTVPTLPLSVHRLRVKKLIIVTEVSPTELEKAQTAHPKPKEVAKESVAQKEDEAAKKTSKKKYSKKGY